MPQPGSSPGSPALEAPAKWRVFRPAHELMFGMPRYTEQDVRDAGERLRAPDIEGGAPHKRRSGLCHRPDMPAVRSSARVGVSRADRRRGVIAVSRTPRGYRASRRSSTAPTAGASGFRTAPGSSSSLPGTADPRSLLARRYPRPRGRGCSAVAGPVRPRRRPGTRCSTPSARPAARAAGPRAPGPAGPGHVDPDEIAFRAVLGQQVSLAGAATLAGRLVADYGEPLHTPLGAVTHLFPAAGALACADPARLPMPASRRGAARAHRGARRGQGRARRPVDRDEARERLLELPGIGPWTADYVAMRALRDPDAFLASDLGVRRALERSGLDGSPVNAARLAERWRPLPRLRAHHLWGSSPNPRNRPATPRGKSSQSLSSARESP